MPVGDDPGAVAETRTLTICLGKNDKVVYYLGLADKPIIPATATGYKRQGLRHALIDCRKKVLAATGKTMLVIIKPAETSVYENLVNTIDELNIAGIQQYAIADIAPKDISILKDKGVY